MPADIADTWGMQIPAKFPGRTRKSARLGRFCLCPGSCGIHFVGWTFVHEHDKGRIDVGFGIEPQHQAACPGAFRNQLRSRAPSQVGGRPASTIPVKGTAVRDGPVPAQGSTIASVQGAATSCAYARLPASTSGSKAATESAQTNRGGRDSAGQMASQKSKLVITLSFPK